MKDASSRMRVVERVLAGFDLVVGSVSVAIAAFFVFSVFWPQTRARDIDGLGLFSALLILPFALLAFAAWHSMRSRDRGRWLLQGATLLPIAFLIVLVVRLALA